MKQDQRNIGHAVTRWSQMKYHGVTLSLSLPGRTMLDPLKAWVEEHW